MDPGSRQRHIRFGAASSSSNSIMVALNHLLRLSEKASERDTTDYAYYIRLRQKLRSCNTCSNVLLLLGSAARTCGCNCLPLASHTALTQRFHELHAQSLLLSATRLLSILTLSLRAPSASSNTPKWNAPAASKRCAATCKRRKRVARAQGVGPSTGVREKMSSATTTTMMMVATAR